MENIPHKHLHILRLCFFGGAFCFHRKVNEHLDQATLPFFSQEEDDVQDHVAPEKVMRMDASQCANRTGPLQKTRRRTPRRT